MKYLNLFLLFLSAIILSALLQWAGMVMPWLFGAMIATVVFYRMVTTHFHYPKWFGNLGLIIIGVEIGSTFTLETLADMAEDYITIIMLSLLIIGLSLLLAGFFMRMTGCTLETAVLASIPGALSQMIVMAEEEKRADLLLVTLTQMSRIVLVVIFVPLIASFTAGSNLTGTNEVASSLTSVATVDMLWMLLGIPAVIYIMTLMKFPVPYMIGPMLVVLTWNVVTDYTFSVDVSFMYAAQLFFGIRIGLQISTLVNQLNKRLILSMLIQNMLLIIGTLGLVMVFLLISEHDFTDLFLSAAPGGIGQIIIVAVEMGANIAMISSYHIFRIFFILLIVAPLINMLLRKNRKRRQHAHDGT
ncbi:AbrB family transcriptional regulator [Salinicoccus sp. ID82-1]|uniref:AbrB family transcriptional regulator n=1 Tax=Salinicoccus sp. ID82-1 TaxID=2820269 RepID=UPI001F48149C|nr:AbrB family transcriptional regulator [Salinicoccus sp. ID82-1]MCG1009189.1 AbrB family transcriptional regulator [Salinicoccus sp. ID82-1]